MSLDYQAILQNVLKIFVECQTKRKNFDVKSTNVDLVTEYDKRVENIIKTELSKIYPHFKFIGEESFGSGCTLTDEPTWMVDPIDGTTNFIHNFFPFCVSIGLCHNKKPVVGAVYLPNLNELYSACKGSGAFLNGKPIKNDFSSALVLTNFGCKMDLKTVEQKTKFIKTILTHESSPHGLGTAAYSICLVAAGFAESFYEWDIYCWDVCASIIILLEAGADDFEIMGGKFVVANNSNNLTALLDIYQNRL